MAHHWILKRTLQKASTTTSLPCLRERIGPESRHTESTSTITSDYSEGDAVLSDLNIDIDAVIKALSKLRPDKSMGPDNLSPKLLIETQKEIAYPLLLLFRKSLQELSVPDDWKKANVSPIFKKGNVGFLPIVRYREKANVSPIFKKGNRQSLENCQSHKPNL